MLQLRYSIECSGMLYLRLSSNFLPVTKKVTAEGGAIFGSAMAKEAVPSACEVPPINPPPQKPVSSRGVREGEHSKRVLKN
jgi:hypothetical protein